MLSKRILKYFIGILNSITKTVKKTNLKFKKTFITWWRQWFRLCTVRPSRRGRVPPSSTSGSSPPSVCSGWSRRSDLEKNIFYIVKFLHLTHSKITFTCIKESAVISNNLLCRQMSLCFFSGASLNIYKSFHSYTLGLIFNSIDC